MLSKKNCCYKKENKLELRLNRMRCNESSMRRRQDKRGSYMRRLLDSKLSYRLRLQEKLPYRPASELKLKKNKEKLEQKLQEKLD